MIRLRVFGVSFVFLALSNAYGQVDRLLAAPGAIKSAAEFLGLIESLDSKVDRLVDKDFKSACDLLEQARIAPRSKKEEIIEEARLAFTKAASVNADPRNGEDMLKYGYSRLGLYYCCIELKDFANARESLFHILEVDVHGNTMDALKRTVKDNIFDSLKATLNPIPYSQRISKIAKSFKDETAMEVFMHDELIRADKKIGDFETLQIKVIQTLFDDANADWDIVAKPGPVLAGWCREAVKKAQARSKQTALFEKIHSVESGEEDSIIMKVEFRFPSRWFNKTEILKIEFFNDQM